MNYLKIVAIATMMVFTFVQCEEGTTEPTDPQTKSGQSNFEITDAPIDDASVEGVFVTVTAIKVDGEMYDGFSGTQTINLMNYQEGNTKVLGMGDLEAKTYSEITLVLDYDADMTGDAPGCYVATVDGMKHTLAASGQSTGEIIIQKSYEIKEDTESSFVLDFDVRKAITYEEDAATATEFQFVTTAELNAAVRFVNKEETGAVDGNMDENPIITSDQVIVFAYEKGTYDSDTEVDGQGASGVTFKNAVSSTLVKENGDYTLAFLEEGDYELHFIAFEDSDNDGKMEAKGELTLNLLTSLGLDLNNVSVAANSSISFNLAVTGIVLF